MCQARVDRVIAPGRWMFGRCIGGGGCGEDRPVHAATRVQQTSSPSPLSWSYYSRQPVQHHSNDSNNNNNNNERRGDVGRAGEDNKTKGVGVVWWSGVREVSTVAGVQRCGVCGGRRPALLSRGPLCRTRVAAAKPATTPSGDDAMSRVALWRARSPRQLLLLNVQLLRSILN